MYPFIDDDYFKNKTNKKMKEVEKLSKKSCMSLDAEKWGTGGCNLVNFVDKV